MPAYQQGVLPLTEGQQEYELSFPGAFDSVPNMILTQVFNQDPLVLTPLYIEAIVTIRDELGFTVTLTQEPNSDDYIMSWFAGDMTQVVMQPGNPGKGLLGLPEYKDPVPGNAYFPAVIPGRVPSTELIRASNLLHAMSNSHQHVARQIVDASVSGLRVMTGTAVEARDALHTPSVDQVTPAINLAASVTSIGTQLVTASTQAQALLVLGTLSATTLQPAVDISNNATALGLSLLYAASSAEARTLLNVPISSHTHSLVSLGAAATLHVHPVEDITGASCITGFLTTTTQPDARAQILAATSTKTVVNIASGGTVSLSSFFSATPGEIVFAVSNPTTLVIDSVGSLLVGQAFEIHTVDSAVSIDLGSNIRLNDGVSNSYYQNFIVAPGTALVVTLVKSLSGVKYLSTNLPYTERSSAKIWVSSAYGNDLTGTPGRTDKAFATLAAAASASVAGDLIVVTPGTYSPSTNLNSNGASWYFEKGAIVQSTYTSPLFSSSSSFPNITVAGYGIFSVTGALVSSTHTNGKVQVECDQIITQVPGSANTLFTVGNSSNTTTVKLKIRDTVSRPSGTFLTLPSGSLTVTADIDMINAQVTVKEILAAAAPFKVTVTGGRIYLGTGLVSGTAGGVTDSTLYILKAPLIGNQSDGAPATISTSNSHVFVNMEGVTRINTRIQPGTGYIVVKDSVTSNDIILDSNTMMMINSSSTGGTYSTLASSNHFLYIGGTLTTNTAITLTHITLVGGTNITLSALATFAPAF